MSTIPHPPHMDHKGSEYWHLADDWTILEGRNILVHDHERVVDQGQVETVTTDGSILWLRQDGSSQRRLIERLPRIYVRIHATEPQLIPTQR